MFKLEQTTCLVLGAGASKSYGFPLGSELKIEIRNQPGREEASTAIAAATNASDELRTEFRDVLRYGTHQTIDILLEENPRFRELGSVAIAVAIIEKESQLGLLPRRGWYNYLYDLLTRAVASNGKCLANLKVVTLNYDRTLEQFLAGSIRYDIPEADKAKAREVLSSLEIVHAHGSLGDIQEYSYGRSAHDHNFVKAAADRIRITSDSVEDTVEFKRAQEVIGEAENLLFMGFGYDLRTLDRLCANRNDGQGQVLGTSVGLSPKRRAYLEERFGPSIFLDEEADQAETSCMSLCMHLYKLTYPDAFGQSALE